MALGNVPLTETRFRLAASKSYSFGLRFLRKSDGRPIALTGTEVFVLRYPKRKGGAVALTKTGTHLDASLGLTQFIFQAADLALPPGDYPFSVTLVSAINYRTLCIEGTCEIRDNADSTTTGTFPAINPGTNLAVYLESGDLVNVVVDKIDGLSVVINDIMDQFQDTADEKIADVNAASVAGLAAAGHAADSANSAAASAATATTKAAAASTSATAATGSATTASTSATTASGQAANASSSANAAASAATAAAGSATSAAASAVTATGGATAAIASAGSADASRSAAQTSAGAAAASAAAAAASAAIFAGLQQTVSDCNTATSNGWYRSDGTITHQPASVSVAFVMIVAHNNSPSMTSQELITFTGEVWRRVHNGTSWSTWRLDGQLPERLGDGLTDYAPVPGTTDDATDNGWYTGSGDDADLPYSDADYSLHVQGNGSDLILQTAVTDGDGWVYKRRYSASHGGWSEWRFDSTLYDTGWRDIGLDWFGSEDNLIFIRRRGDDVEWLFDPGYQNAPLWMLDIYDTAIHVGFRPSRVNGSIGSGAKSIPFTLDDGSPLGTLGILDGSFINNGSIPGNIGSGYILYKTDDAPPASYPGFAP